MQPEDLERISPALVESPTTQLSSKEFQRMLYSWFEERGLVADLRSYLRVLMINELKNKSVGKLDHKTGFSLSKQAFCLVVAEHLLREGCYYTLSIFSTEVPNLINQLPVSLFDAHSKNENWRFDQDSLLNVLELMGISRGSDECLRVASLYLKNKNSLLACLVHQKSANLEVGNIDEGSDYLNNVLEVLGVPQNMTDNIKKKIYECIDQQIPNDRRRIEEMESLLVERNNQIKLLLDDQIGQKKEIKKLKNELKETHKRLKKSLLQEQQMNLKETELREKLDKITRLQKNLEKSLTKETCLQKHCTDTCQELAAMNQELKDEIGRLEKTNAVKNTEIEKLNIKISALIKDLQSSKLNIEFLNSCLVKSSQINLHQGDERSPPSEEASDTVTAEILQGVRSRLHDLERESDELYVKFKKLRLNEFVIK